MVLGIVGLVIGYLLGSFPTAYIVARIRRGIDIRTVDIGNVGAGSVMRAVGLWEGIIVIIVDVAKGAASIWVAWVLGVSELWILGAGITAILGHIFPFYIGFRGGQGVATVMGIFFILTPEAMAVCWVILGIIIVITRRLFLRHLFSWVCVVAPFLPLFIWIFDGSSISIVEINTVYGQMTQVGGTWLLIYYALVIIVFLVVKNRHRLKEVKTATSETSGREKQPLAEDTETT